MPSPIAVAPAGCGAPAFDAGRPSLDLHDDRKDHRPSLRLVVQVTGHRVLDLALEESDLADVVARVLDGRHHPRGGRIDDRVALVSVHEAAGDDLRNTNNVARLLVDRDHDHEHTVVGQRAPVAEDDLADLADGQAVHEDIAGRDRLPAPGRPVGVDLDGLAVLDDENVLREDARLDRQAAVLDRHPKLAVDRDEVPGLGAPEHEFELFLACVAGHVSSLDRVVEHVRACLEQVVDRAADVLLVAGDRAGADDHRVARLDLDEPVVAVGHPGEAGHWLALAAGRCDDELLGGDLADLVLADDLTCRVFQVAEIAGDPEVLLHRPADDGYLAIERRGGVQDLLDARDVARERGDDNPPVDRFHDLAEGIADGPLRRGIARVLGAGGVGQQADDALRTQPGQNREVGQLAVHGCVVELEVAGVDNRAHRRPQGKSHRVRNRMADPEGEDAERPDLELVPRLHGYQRVVVELVLPDLVAQEAAGERAGIDRDSWELGQHVWQPTHVVLVCVGDQEGPDVGPAFLEIGDVGDDEVDVEHLLVREHEPAIDHDDVVAVLEDVHVLADLANPAEGDDSKRRAAVGHRGFRLEQGDLQGVGRISLGGGRQSRRRARGLHRTALVGRHRLVGGPFRIRHIHHAGLRGGRQIRDGVRCPLALAAPAGLDQGRRQAADVLEQGRLVAGVAHGIGGVVHGERLGLLRAGGRAGFPAGAVDLTDPFAGPERGQRKPPQRHHHGRLEDGQLPSQERCAGRDLVGRRVAVTGWPALHDVRDEDVVAAPPERPDEPGQQLARLAHERPALGVLVATRSLADEHHLSRRMSLARHGLRSLLVEPTAGAGANLAGDGLERRAALGIRHAEPARSDARRTQPRAARSSAISTAFVAAPLRRLSLTTQKARPRPSAIEGSWRTRPTNTSSRPAASVASGYRCAAGSSWTLTPGTVPTCTASEWLTKTGTRTAVQLIRRSGRWRILRVSWTTFHSSLV